MAKRLNPATRQTTDAFRDLGESKNTARVLAALVGHRVLRLEAVAKRSGYGPLTARKALGILVERGWVTTTRLPSTRRGPRPLGYTLKASRRSMLEYYRRHAWRQVAMRFKDVQSSPSL